MSPEPDNTISRSAWQALAVAQLATFLAVIDISAVNVAFPSIVDDFDSTRTTVGWIVSGYNVTVGALLLAAGRLADSYGRRRVFIPGVALFMVGSALSGASISVGMLIAARIIQAAGGAVVIASAFAVVLPDFPPARRSTAIGFAGATGALGAVVGPALGSVLIDAFGWRSIFWINIPLCLLVLVLAPRLLRESRDPNATGRIDVVGVIIGTVAVAALMAGIVQSETWGLTDPRVIGLIVVGLALFPTLINRSRTHPEALLNLTLFRYRSFASANHQPTVGFVGRPAGPPLGVGSWQHAVRRQLRRSGGAGGSRACGVEPVRAAQHRGRCGDRHDGGHVVLGWSGRHSAAELRGGGGNAEHDPAGGIGPRHLGQPDPGLPRCVPPRPLRLPIRLGLGDGVLRGGGGGGAGHFPRWQLRRPSPVGYSQAAVSSPRRSRHSSAVMANRMWSSHVPLISR